MTAPIDGRIRLRDEEVLLTVSSQILDLIGDAAVRHLAIRCFNKTKLVDARESTHRADQADVWTFRRFDRANATVVRRMNVAHFKAGALTAQTARPESGQTPLVCQLCQRIRLIHKL